MKIESNEVKSALETGKRVLLLDVRTPAEHGEKHIAGSRLMPLERWDGAAARSLVEEAEEVVLVCRSGNRAEQARRKLEEAGCEGPRVLEGGVLAWERAGLPLERGKSVLSLERQVRIAAGGLVLAGVLLGWQLHGGFFALSGFVGAGLMFAGITDWCGMAMLLAKMPWNQRSGVKCEGASCSV